jgi:hypothetical protein
MAVTRSFKKDGGRPPRTRSGLPRSSAARERRNHARRRPLGEGIGTPPKSLIRVFGPKGNLNADNLFRVLSHLQKKAGIELHIA